jgi:hypothetical protein
MCPICGRADPEHVDHSHDTGVVRGILCFNCNGGLGQFRDSPDTLRDAAGYLEASDQAARELMQIARLRAVGLRGSAV